MWCTLMYKELKFNETKKMNGWIQVEIAIIIVTLKEKALKGG